MLAGFAVIPIKITLNHLIIIELYKLKQSKYIF